MANKAQKQARKARQKQTKRRTERQRAQRRSGSPALRLRVRLSKEKPERWRDERTEDVALFDDQALAQLSPELAEQASLVRTALSLVCQSHGADALEPLSVISRRSPYADWRLFLRGFVDWLDGKQDAAAQAWSRLDPARRPHRIAASLLLAHRDDLAVLTPVQYAGSSNHEQPNWPQQIDAELIQGANLVRRVRIDRVAIRTAKQICDIPMELEDAQVTPTHIRWLKDFTNEFGAIEPDLVQALHEVTTSRAFCGRYVDIFQQCVKSFRGPIFDPQNLYIQAVFCYESEQQETGDKWIDKLIGEVLPQQSGLSPQIQKALGSSIYVRFGEVDAAPHSEYDMINLMFNFRGQTNKNRNLQKYLDKAVSLYPKHRAAWRRMLELLQDELDDPQLLKAGRDKLEAKAAKVRQRWVKALPDDIEPRLDLVDYLLEHDRSDEAKKHVDFLAGNRYDNPLVDSIQWRWSLLEAMRLTCRKAWLSQVPAHLDEAERLWPKWLSAEWLPYLQAAYELRCGNPQALQQLSPQTTSSVLDACMKLGAAQKMHVPSAELKPLRQAVDGALKNVKSCSLDDLLRLASFYWDLQRVRMKYPAYRLHGPKFLKRLHSQLKDNQFVLLDRIDEPLVRGALLALADDNFFNDRYRLQLFDCFNSPETWQHHVVASVAAKAAIQVYMNWGLPNLRAVITTLRQAALSSDAFYRHFYNSLADQLDARQPERSTPYSFGGNEALDFYDDDDDDDDEFDYDCDCDDCRAARGELEW
ncbi:MAG: hypothetical protein R3C28_20040 [Pirellulaceae bacterium]